jgi:transposase
MPGPISDRQKKRLRIQKLLELGWNIQEIAEEEECDRNTVSRWKRRFEQGESEQDRNRTGRPSKLSPTLRKQVMNHVRGKTHRSTRKTAKWLATEKGVAISNFTVHRILHQEGCHPRHRNRQQKLTDAHKKKRVAFAKKFKEHNWNSTLMTDEAEFRLTPKGNTKNDVVWVRDGDTVPPLEQDNYSPSVRFWAGAAASGRTSLHFYEGTLDGARYREILEDALPEMEQLFDQQDWTFLHDGAPAHSDKKTNDWLEAHVPSFIKSGPSGEWPAKSPDLNWIENLFGIMSAKVTEPRAPTSRASLKRRLKRTWDEITDETLQNCARSMPQRLRDLIQTKGAALRK